MACQVGTTDSMTHDRGAALLPRGRRRGRAAIVGALLTIGWSAVIWAQRAPALAFREDWAISPPATPLTQTHVVNRDLTVALYGPGAAHVKKSHHDQPADDPYYVWSGETPAPWAVALRHRVSAMDLRGAARVRWRARQSGFHELRLIIKLANGAWLIAAQADGPSADWRESEMRLASQRWYALDITRIAEGRPVDSPDLSQVDEIGVTDLRAGAGTPASARLDWIEVYGTLVPRDR